MASPPPLPADRTGGSSLLQYFSDGGSAFSLHDLTVPMVVLSDNTATNMLIDRLGMDRINRTMTEFGFPNTRLVNRLHFPTIGADAKNLAVTTPGELCDIMTALGTTIAGIPMVLVVAVGHATRLIEYVQEQGKTYRATIRFGATSDTDDLPLPKPAAPPCPSKLMV